jgi:molybdopterin-synthase adenylyltransferase
LVGDRAALHRKLISFDLWENRFQAVDPGPRAEDCRTCHAREFRYLQRGNTSAVRLCGRNSVQIHDGERRLDFSELGPRLRAHGAVRFNSYVMKFSVAPYEMTIFPDGRVIIKGTEDAELARSLYARYIGC